MLFSHSTIFTFLTASVLFSSCASVKESPSLVKDTELITDNEIIQHDMETIYQGALFINDAPVVTPGGMVITSEDQWTSLIGKMSGSKDISRYFEVNEINFEEEMVIAYFDIMRGSKNTTVTIESISEKLQGLFVNYAVVTNNSDAAAEVMNQPCMLVKMKKRNKEVTFSSTF